MKILHTADLHLKEISDVSILQEIISCAESHGAELILIAGDLFDSSADADSLKEALKPIWNNYSGDVLIIQGNHDFSHFKGDKDWAENVSIANDRPYSVCEIDGTIFVCVPYQKDVSLADIDLPHADILVTHGTFKRDVYPEDIVGKYRYVALGHYHDWFDTYIEGCMVVNPGSPCQNVRRGKGPRCVSLLDTHSWLMERIILPVSFTEYKMINISVLDSNKEICTRLEMAAGVLVEYPNARLTLILQGSLAGNHMSINKRAKLWEEFLKEKGIDTARISWDLENVLQISDEVMYSSFARALIDKIAEDLPNELNKLAPYLLERLQETKNLK